MSKANAWQENGGPVIQRPVGMDLLDHFASLAMQKMVPEWNAQISSPMNDDAIMQTVASRAYRQAHFMVVAARAARMEKDERAALPSSIAIDVTYVRNMALRLEGKANHSERNDDKLATISVTTCREIAFMLLKLIGDKQ